MSSNSRRLGRVCTRHGIGPARRDEVFKRRAPPGSTCREESRARRKTRSFGSLHNTATAFSRWLGRCRWRLPVAKMRRRPPSRSRAVRVEIVEFTTAGDVRPIKTALPVDPSQRCARSRMAVASSETKRSPSSTTTARPSRSGGCPSADRGRIDVHLPSRRHERNPSCRRCRRQLSPDPHSHCRCSPRRARCAASRGPGNHHDRGGDDDLHDDDAAAHSSEHAVHLRREERVRGEEGDLPGQSRLGPRLRHLRADPRWRGDRRADQRCGRGGHHRSRPASR